MSSIVDEILYPPPKPSAPGWDKAPPWAKFLAQDEQGKWFWCSVAPDVKPKGYAVPAMPCQWQWCDPRRQMQERPC